jgi:hypothetical protein
MKVLIISAITLPASLSGPAYIAGAELAPSHPVKSSNCPQASELKTCKTAPQVKQQQFCRISVPYLGSVPNSESGEYVTSILRSEC